MGETPKTLYIVDGSAYIYRAFFAIRRLANSKGFPTNALYGFVQMLKKLIEQEDPEHLAITFDRYDEEDEQRSFRHALYDQYKANRDTMPDDLRLQVPFFEQIVRAMNIPVLIQSGVEADDVIATLTRQARELGWKVCIVSADKDLMQLLSDDVVMLDTMRDKRYTPVEAKERFGVEPGRIRDVMALSGDTSDNIPGVPGIGEKTGGQLIAQFGDLESLLARVDEVSGKKRQENLRTYAAQARLSLELVTLRDDCDVVFDPEALKLSEPDLPALASVMQGLEFHSMHKALLAWFKRRGLLPPDEITGAEMMQAQQTLQGVEGAHGQQLLFGMSDEPVTAPVRSQQGPPRAAAHKRYETIYTHAQLDALIATLEAAPRYSVDLETTSLDTLDAQIVGLSFAWQPDAAVYIPVAHEDERAPAQLPLSEVLAKLKPLLEDQQPKKVGQNIKYELRVFKRYGISYQGILYDTMLMSYLLDPVATHSLDAIAKRTLGHQTITYEEVAGKGKKQVPFAQVPVEIATDYAAEDADITLMACAVMEVSLRAASDLQRLHDTMEVPLTRVLAAMEHTGVCIDQARLKELSGEFALELEALEIEINSHVPEAYGALNINSPKQLGEVLFEHLGLPVKRRTKSGPSTDQSVLEQLAELHPLPRLILEYRKFSKLKSTYIDALPTLVRADTGRVHTDFNQAIAATGRLSSSNPNLQNIPIRTDRGKQIRAAFVPRAGWVLMAADYSQIELRVMAHIADDPTMIEAFNRGDDVHALAASRIFDLPLEEVTSEQRSVGKTINFGVLFGMGANRLSASLGISNAQARAYIDSYFERFAKVKAYFDRTIQEAEASGQVHTLFGRVRLMPELTQAGGMRAFGERAAMNAPIQGTAADIIKRAMITLQDALQDSGLPASLLLQVHDELVLEVAPEAVEQVRALVVHHMETAATLKVPLRVDVGVGPSWLET